MRECYIKCGYEIKLLFSQVKLNQRKKNRTKKYENKNKKFSYKRISVGEIRRYQNKALNGGNWGKGSK